MTIDERLEALAQTIELIAANGRQMDERIGRHSEQLEIDGRHIRQLAQIVADHHGDVQRVVNAIFEQRADILRVVNAISEQRADILRVSNAVEHLLDISASHERRITHIDGGATDEQE